MSTVSFFTITKKEYYEYIKDVEVDWLQSREFVEFREKLGWKNHFFKLEDGEGVKIIATLSEKNKYFEIVMGPTFLENGMQYIDEFMPKIKRFCKQNNARYLNIYPKIIRNKRDDKYNIFWTNKNISANQTLKNCKNGFTEDYGKVVNTLVYVKDLSKVNSENVEETYRYNVRYSLRKSKKLNMKIKEAINNDEIIEVINNINESNLKNGVEGKSGEYYQYLKETHKEKAKFMYVEYENIVVSAGIFIDNCDEIIYFEGGSKQKYKKIPAATFLQNYMIKFAIESGKSQYNFYGIHGNRNDRNLLNFKSGFRGYIIEYVGSVELNWFWNKVVFKLKK